MKIENTEAATVAATAHLFGISRQRVSQGWVKGGCPRNKDGTFNLPKVVAWKLERTEANEEAAGPDGRFTDHQLRRQEIAADLAELELAEKRGQLVSRAQTRESLARLATILRGAGETLQREFGQGAARVLEEALADFEREVKLAHGNGDGESKKPAKRAKA